MKATAEGAREWEAEPGKPITGHEQVLKKCHWRGHYCVEGAGFSFWCADKQIRDGWVELTGVLADTSDRFQGITMKQRLTFHERLVLVNVSVLLMPYRHSLAETPDESHQTHDYT